MKENGKHVGYIYSITNKSNCKAYVGLTIQKIEIRWNQHKKLNTSLISKVIAEEGEYNFRFKIEETVICNTENELRKELAEAEKFYIKEFDCLESGYNSTSGGYAGFAVSEETRQKLSEVGKGKNKGRKLSEQHKKNISESHKGKTFKHSEETIDKIRKSNLSLKRSEKTIEKIRKAVTGTKQSKKTVAKRISNRKSQEYPENHIWFVKSRNTWFIRENGKNRRIKRNKIN